MVQLFIVAVRVLFGVMLALVGLFMLMQGFAMLAFQDFAFFAGTDLAFVCVLCVAGAVLFAAYRLLRTTLTLQAT